MKIIVIGGGPAGMMAAISASENGNDVTIIEKMKSVGKKLLITGKGRCNITNGIDISDFIKNIPGNGSFLYSSFKNFTNIDLINFFKEQGLEVKEERGNRIFPKSDKSIDVLNVLTKKLKELNVKIITDAKVDKIIVENGAVIGVRFNNQELKCDKVILTTGGRSYSATGSTGDGYKLAEDVGHSVTEIFASLVPLECYENMAKELQGLSLKNVAVKAGIIECPEINNLSLPVDWLRGSRLGLASRLLISGHSIIPVYEDFGEMLFTHFGVSGPIILSGSAHLLRVKNIKELLKNKQVKLFVDLKPALDSDKLDLRIRRDFEELKNKQFKNSLDKLLPKKLIDVIINLSKIDREKQVNSITKEERLRLVNLLKNLEFTIKDFRPIEEAIITSGGVNTKEINPSTMESKIVNGLYFAGEVIDVDAYTGGFNLQIAFSTGYTAGIG